MTAIVQEVHHAPGDRGDETHKSLTIKSLHFRGNKRQEQSNKAAAAQQMGTKSTTAVFQVWLTFVRDDDDDVRYSAFMRH